MLRLIVRTLSFNIFFVLSWIVLWAAVGTSQGHDLIALAGEKDVGMIAPVIDVALTLAIGTVVFWCNTLGWNAKSEDPLRRRDARAFIAGSVAITPALCLWRATDGVHWLVAACLVLAAALLSRGSKLGARLSTRYLPAAAVLAFT